MEPEITAQEMCKEMVEHDHKEARRLSLLKRHNLKFLIRLKARKNEKDFVAGHREIVGSSICRHLANQSGLKVITRSRKDLDLTNQNDVGEFKKEKIDEVILAAKVEVSMLTVFIPQFIFENLQIQNNIIHLSHINNVQSTLLGSSCIYPKFAKQPMTGMLY